MTRLRKNKISSLPESFPGINNSSLKLLHLSSNLLSIFPESLIDCPSLEKLYANTNNISRIPVGFGRKLTHLTHVNLSHNHLEELPDDFIERFGTSNEDGEFEKVREMK